MYARAQVRALLCCHTVPTNYCAFLRTPSSRSTSLSRMQAADPNGGLTKQPRQHHANNRHRRSASWDTHGAIKLSHNPQGPKYKTSSSRPNSGSRPEINNTPHHDKVYRNGYKPKEDGGTLIDPRDQRPFSKVCSCTSSCSVWSASCHFYRSGARATCQINSEMNLACHTGQAAYCGQLVYPTSFRYRALAFLWSALQLHFCRRR